MQLEAHAPSVPPSDSLPLPGLTEDPALTPLTTLTALDDAIENLGVPVPCRATTPRSSSRSPRPTSSTRSPSARPVRSWRPAWPARQERREPWGVWGGELFVQGVVVARKRPRGRPRKNPVAA
ncbi:WhiB family transcriptional regulator [Streptomyces tanashiensis]